MRLCQPFAPIAVLSVLSAFALGCGDDYGTGDLEAQLDPEATITDGLDPGDGLENIVDGWTVRFHKYLIAVGDIKVGTDPHHIRHHDPTMHVVDMTSLPPAGFSLARFEAIDARRWDFFGYTTGHADDAIRHDGVSEGDMDEMVANGWTYLIEGTITNPEGESCPPTEDTCYPAAEVSFRFGIPSYTEMVGCEAEGIYGVSVAENTTTSVNLSIHGDHMLFDSFPTGPEIVDRRAQWIANADLDQDGTVIQEELQSLALEDLFPSSLYSYEGAPMEMETAWDYIVAQAHTQGHFQGEGHCTWCLEEGECVEDDHDHGHDH